MFRLMNHSESEHDYWYRFWSFFAELGIILKLEVTIISIKVLPKESLEMGSISVMVDDSCGWIHKGVLKIDLFFLPKSNGMAKE